MLIWADSNMQMRREWKKCNRANNKQKHLCRAHVLASPSSPLAVIYSLITYIICCMVALILFIIFIGSKISIGRIIILACLFHNFNTTTKSVQSIDVNRKKAKQSRKWKQRSRRFMKQTRKPQRKNKLLNV